MEWEGITRSDIRRCIQLMRGCFKMDCIMGMDKSAGKMVISTRESSEQARKKD